MNEVRVRKASFAEAPNIMALLNIFFPNRQHWQKLFQPRSWHIDNDFPGFVLTEKQKIVGFLGTIISHHDVGGKKITIANLTSWYVLPTFRKYSLLLLKSVLQLPNITITNLSADPSLYSLLLRMGFKPFRKSQRLVIPMPKLPTIRSRNLSIREVCDVKNLNTQERNIFSLHDGLNCYQFVIQYKDQRSYCIAVKTTYKKLPIAKIYYVSNEQFFNKILKNFSFKLCFKLKAAYLLIESETIDIDPWNGIYNKTLSTPRLYRSNILNNNSDVIPILCSEWLVLGI